MKRTAGLIWFAALLVALTAQTGNAQAAAKKTIWDGVYTEAQATRGQKTVQQNCGSCHSPASEWSTSMFIAAWTGRPIRELHSHIRSTMPFNQPGKLSAQEYADIVAYMLKLNKVPAGRAELPADNDGLGNIEVTKK